MNTETKFTPGPWRGGRAICGSTGLICRVVSKDGGWKSKTDAIRYNYASAPTDEREADANACLIAAAPALFEALTLALATLERLEPAHTHGPFSTIKGTLDVTRAALALAGGGK